MKNIKSIIFEETQRLYISLPDVNDAPFFLELLNTSDWLRYIGDKNVKSLDDAANYITTLANDQDRTYWLVRLKSDDKAIGMVSMIQRDYLDYPDFGFAFLPTFYKQGYAQEASRIALSTFFSTNNINNIFAITLKENNNSALLLKRLGFQIKKELTRNNEIINQFELTQDKFNLDHLVFQFFNLFNNKNKTDTNWNSINDICITDAFIIKKTGLQSEVYSIQSFIEPRKKILTDGTLLDFEEKETNEETIIIKHIAQRYSTYIKSGIWNDKPYHGTGHKFFQFINTNAGWKISALVWEDD